MSARSWIGLSGVLGLLLLVASQGLPGGVAVAAEGTSAPQPQPVCTVTDQRLNELSGLAVGPEHWFAVNDGGKRVEVFVLGHDCDVRRVITNPTNPYDVEDMARAEDGTLWLGDTGDNSMRRDTVALHAVRPDGSSTLYRLTYPDGKHNAEALVLGGDGNLYIITKSALGTAGVYRPAKELRSPGPVPLEQVAKVQIDMTDTPGGPIGAVGTTMITAAALSPDGTVLAIRTYTDVYLYPTSGGDVVAALRHEPQRIPLPGAPQGEAIAFTAEGALLAASEGVGEPIRKIPGVVAMVEPATVRRDSGGKQPQARADAEESGLPTIPAALLALLLGGALIFGLSRMRRRR